MQRLSTIMLGSLVAMGAQAQLNTAIDALHPKDRGHRPTTWDGSTSEAITPRGGGPTVYFNEDFANGLSGNNGIGPWTTSGPDGALWLYDTDGPNGFYSDPADEVIESTTAANGFMIFDSDAANTIGGNPAPVFTEWVGSLESPVLDLSTAFNPRLEFEMRSRFCCTDGGHFVDVSTDGGLTWPTRLDAEFGVAVNADPGTFTGVINLACAIAADPSNVKFRFTQDGLESGAMTHYFWQIDDVAVVEGPVNDLAIQNMWLVEDADDYDNTATRNQEYTRLPLEQAGPLSVSFALRNNGGAAQPNVLAEVEVFQDGASQGTFTATVPSFAVCAADSIVINTGWVPTAPGDVDVVLTLSSDSLDTDPSDNVAQKSFVVTDTPASEGYAVMAVDTNARDGQISLAQSAAYSIMGNLFEMQNAGSTCYAVGVCFGTDTDPGAIVNITVEDDLGVVGEIIAFEVQPNMLTAPGQANWVNISFDTGPFPIDPMMDYAVFIESPGADTVAICLSGDVNPGGLYGYDNDAAMLFRFIGFGNPALMARMYLADAPTVGIEELEDDGLRLGGPYPNPASVLSTIQFELEASRNVTLQVHDLNGRVVRTLDLGERSPGPHRVDLDVRELASGVYNCTIQAGEARLSRRLVVGR